MAPRLVGHELVVHVFVVADGPDARDGYADLVALWDRSCLAFGIADPLGTRPVVPPADVPASDGVIAIRAGSTGGMYQAVLRWAHDVLCLTVLQAPTPGSGPRWDTLDARWSAVLAPPLRGVVGSVRIRQARQIEATPLDAAALGRVVRWDTSIPGNWWRTGVVRPEPPLGPFAVWDASDAVSGQIAWDGRVDRRIVVVAEPHRDPELSAWTWTRGDGELTPFTRYLLHAAKLRYELRVWGRQPGATRAAGGHRSGDRAAAAARRRRRRHRARSGRRRSARRVGPAGRVAGQGSRVGGPVQPAA